MMGENVTRNMYSEPLRRIKTQLLHLVGLIDYYTVFHDVITSSDGAQEFRIPVGQMYALQIDTAHTPNRFIGTRQAYTVLKFGSF